MSVLFLSVLCLMSIAGFVAAGDHEKMREALCSDNEAVAECMAEYTIEDDLYEHVPTCCPGIASNSGSDLQKWMCSEGNDPVKCCECMEENAPDQKKEAEKQIEACAKKASE